MVMAQNRLRGTLKKIEMMILLMKILVVTLAWTSGQCDTQSSFQFFLQKSSENEYEALIAVLFTKRGEEISIKCELFTHKDEIKEVLESSKNSPVTTISGNETEIILNECTEMVAIEDTHEILAAADTTPSDTETTTPGYDGIPVIFPGTKWCGAGDIAKNYDDLGLHQDTDRCCRAHDHCNDTLAPGETKNKLKNTSPFTKLSCKCDHDFYDCLDRVNSVASNTIGNMYFNILKRECYQEDYPIKYPKKCKKYRSFLKITCKEYVKNTNGAKVYEWIRAKKYKKIPIPGPLTVHLPF